MQIVEEMKKIDTLSIQNKTKGKWFNLVLANVIAVVFVILGLFMPLLSFALAVIVASYMQVGVYGYVLKTYQNASPSFESIFIDFKWLLKVLCIKIIVMAGMLIWGLLLIVPGIIYALNYAFAAFVFYENPQLSIEQILATSKQMTNGKKFGIFLMALGMIALACLAASIGVGLYYLFALFFNVPIFLTVILIVVPTVLMIMLVSLPLFETYLAGLYENSKASTQEQVTIKKRSVKKVTKN